MVEPQPAYRDVSGECAADRDDAETAQARQIERRVNPVRLERRERHLDGPPLGRRRELGPVGLPRPDDVGGPGAGCSARRFRDVERDAGPPPGVDHAATRREVEGDLDEPAVVLERDHAAHPQRRSPGHRLARHRAGGDTAHDAVGDELPARADCGMRRFLIESIDDAVRRRHGDPPCSRRDDRAAEH